VPWAKPRRELLLLALVAVAVLGPVYVISPQDISRLCLTHALVHGQVKADACLSTTMAVDKASNKGHLYSDKAPGMSVLEIPVAAAVQIPALPTTWPWEFLSLWVVRIAVSGIAFLVCAFLVGRIAEGLAPGWGGAALVASSLGTLMAPFAVANFDHVPAAALGFGAFALAWRRHPLLAGLAGGATFATEYEAGLILVIVGVYVALQGGWALGNYVYGAIPATALLWTYDWLAFGSPWSTPYGHVANQYTAEQAKGFFGIHLPRLHAVHEVFVGHGGLFVISPIVFAAGAGLFLLPRRYRAEAIVCGAVVLAFVILNCGYFLPYGGSSPGPRFLIPALPFVAVGLGPVFARWPRVVAVIAVLSVVPMTALAYTWPNNPIFRGTVWGEVIRLPLGTSRIGGYLATNALDWLHLARSTSAVIAALAAASACALAFLRLERSLR
jgi:hypothetical protein